MISYIRNISIKYRFTILVIIVAALMLSMVFYFLVTLNKIKNYQKYTQQISELTTHYLNTRRYEQNFITRNSDDPAFFTTHENKYLKKHENAVKSFNKILENIKDGNLTQKLKLEENINQIITYQSNYNAIFNEIVQKIILRGSESSGIIENMIIVSDEAIKQAFGNSNLTNRIFELKQNADNYLVTKDIKHHKIFVANFAELTKSFGGAYTANLPENLPDTVSVTNIETSDDIIKNLNDFKQYFESLTEIDKQLGTSYQDGLLGNLRDEILKLDPEIEQLSIKINGDKNKVINSVYNSVFIFSSVILLLLIFIIMQFSYSITRPIEILQKELIPLSKGNIPDKLRKIKGKDEISAINESLNELVEGLKQTTSFAITIGQGIFDTDYKPLSSDDKLGNSLLEMRQNLNQAKIDEEKRKKEDDMRKWANEGLAQFNDILRQNTGDIKILSDIVITKLVHFLNANQAGLFIYNNTDPADLHFDLVSSYAYGHEKKKQKKIYPGEGLIGTAAVEKETVYMTDIPPTYITITSGLGGATPNSLLIVPMKVEDEVFGVIEIASFNAFMTHEIEFVEKVSENIAASLSITRINTRTAELLQQSQMQAEQMAAQDQEMRRNFEELQMAQEESARREAEMTSILSAIDDSSLVIEIDTKGYITSVNRNLLDLLAVPETQIVGTLHQSFISPEDENDYLKFWLNVKDGKHIQRFEKIVIGEKEFWFSVIYAAILDDTGSVVKILSLATDFTESKKLELELKRQAEMMSEQEEIMRQNLEVLHSTQKDMAEKQAQLEEINVKSIANERILKKAVEKSKQQENELLEKLKDLNRLKEELEEQKYITGSSTEFLLQDPEITVKLDELNSKHLIAKYKADGTFEDANDLFYQTFGYNKSDIFGKHHRLFIEPDLRKSNEYLSFWDNLRLGQSVSGEFVRINKQNAPLFFKGTYKSIADKSEKITNIIEILENITEYKKLQTDLQEISNGITQGFSKAVFDIKGEIIDVNNIFAQLIEFDPDELTQLNYKDLVNEEYADSIEYLHFWRDLSRGAVISDIFEFTGKNKKISKQKGAFTAIREISGEITKVIYIGTDIGDILQ